MAQPIAFSGCCGSLVLVILTIDLNLTFTFNLYT